MMKKMYFKNLCFVTANSSTITSDAATYIKVPVDNPSTIPSSNSFDPLKHKPRIIPTGVNNENIIINIKNVFLSVPAFVNEIPLF